MKNKFRIAFFGTPDFAVASLQKIVEGGFNVVAVITAPDKPSGRGQQLSISDVKKYSLATNLDIYQPEKLKDPDFVNQYQSLEIDLAIVVAFRMMPEVIWSAPKIGTFNLHGSLLPNYRGAAPINWALINGEKETGVTTFFINSKIDEGEILFQERYKIKDEDNFGSVYNELKDIGASLVLKTIIELEKGPIKTSPQSFTEVDHLAPKIEKEILEITDFSSGENLHNLLRGLWPVYKPYFIYNDKKYIIKSGHFQKSELRDMNPISKAQIYTDSKSYLKLICQDGLYNILEIQAEGKKPMDIRSFFNGNVI